MTVKLSCPEGLYYELFTSPTSISIDVQRQINKIKSMLDESCELTQTQRCELQAEIKKLTCDDRKAVHDDSTAVQDLISTPVSVFPRTPNQSATQSLYKRESSAFPDGDILDRDNGALTKVDGELISNELLPYHKNGDLLAFPGHTPDSIARELLFNKALTDKTLAAVKKLRSLANELSDRDVVEYSLSWIHEKSVSVDNRAEWLAKCNGSKDWEKIAWPKCRNRAKELFRAKPKDFPLKQFYKLSKFVDINGYLGELNDDSHQSQITGYFQAKRTKFESIHYMILDLSKERHLSVEDSAAIILIAIDFWCGRKTRKRGERFYAFVNDGLDKFSSHIEQLSKRDRELMPSVERLKKLRSLNISNDEGESYSDSVSSHGTGMRSAPQSHEQSVIAKDQLEAIVCKAGLTDDERSAMGNFSWGYEYDDQALSKAFQKLRKAKDRLNAKTTEEAAV